MPALPLERMPPAALKGVGAAVDAKLRQLGVATVQDLLFHLPLRYEDRTATASIGSIRPGETVQLEGKVAGGVEEGHRRRSFRCLLKDDTGAVSLRFFHYIATQRRALVPGARIRCHGKVQRGRRGAELIHPEYTVLQDGRDAPGGGALTPIYPLTEGLYQARLRGIIGQALELMERPGALPELLPPELGRRLGLPSLPEAVRLVHRPPADALAGWERSGEHPGRHRLAFEELLAHQLCMRRLKDEGTGPPAPAMTKDSGLARRFVEALPFSLTGGQRRAVGEIARDLAADRPMQRLLQGDVGSGKTVAAALAALVAIDGGWQTALMAPTEILAEQHFMNFARWFEPLGVHVSWLSGRHKGAQRRKVLESLAAGDCRLLVGTHALFQDDVVYHRLGLVVIDEQHRFGVHQRLALRDKSRDGRLSPHQLVMTATPIPRTLAMSAYADLDVSVIRELPPGRLPVNTALVSGRRRDEVVRRIARACAGGSQAYWVCTLIEESESLQAQAAEATAARLAEQLPGVAVGLVHGRMKPEEKQAVMERFKGGGIRLLVATTVIEVGVDVPAASLMIIENPERLGLAQLHQLRGRVGRGARRSHCLLLYQAPLSDAAKQRLAVMRESADGFHIAEKDLQLRGPGQVLGTRQTGMMDFRVADLALDAGMLDEVKSAAGLIMSQHPEAVDPLVGRWVGRRADFFNV